MTINNEHKKLNVPNLRFPEFQGEWEKHELGDICETITDFVAAGSFASLRENVKYYQEDNYAQLVRTVDLKKDFTNNDFVYVDELAYDFLWRVQLKEPNIILPNIGANIGEKYYVSPEDLPKEKNVLGPNAILLRSKCNDTHFVYFRLSTSSYDNEMKKLVGASGQPKFNKTDLKKVRLFMPSLKEQKKISHFLGLLEERIATQNKIIDKLQSLIKGIGKQLFMDNQNWRTVKIGELLRIGNGKDYKHLCIGKIPVYGTGGQMLLVNDYLYDGESVCIGRKGTIDTPMFLKGKFWTVDTLFYTYDFKDVLPKFCYYLFLQINWKLYNEGTGVPSLSKSTIENIKVKIPSLEQQQKICSILDCYEHKTNNEEQILELYHSEKQYLLRQTFI